MKKFEVTITETLIKKIIVDAETAEEAENIADSMNFKGEMDLNPYVYEFAKLLELAVLYDRNREIKKRFKLLADNFEYELSEDSKNCLLERNATLRLIGYGDK